MAAEQGPSGPELSTRVVETLFELTARLRADVAQALADLDLTDALADALWALDPTDGPLARRTLADRLHCDPSNVTFLAHRLVERGLLERVDDPGDRRVRALTLTAEGRAARERLGRALQAALERAGVDEDTQRALLTLLARQPADIRA